jgi:hypothetical protein
MSYYDIYRKEVTDIYLDEIKKLRSSSIQVAELTQLIKTPPIELLSYMIKLVETEDYYANYTVLASIARYKDEALRYRENLKAIKVSIESGKVKIQHKEYTTGVLDFILGEESEHKQ